MKFLHIGGLVQERCNSIANALELRLSYINVMMNVGYVSVDQLLQIRTNIIMNYKMNGMIYI